MPKNYLNLTDEEWEQHLLSVSITSWNEDDFHFMGYYTRHSLAKNGDPINKTCAGKYDLLNHNINLIEENNIIYLICTECFHTEILTNKVTHHVQPNKGRGIEWKF